MKPEEAESKAGGEHPVAKPVSDALGGAVYPLTRDELIWVARENEAPSTVLSLLSSLPPRRFRSLDDVQRAIDDAQTADRDPSTGGSGG